MKIKNILISIISDANLQENEFKYFEDKKFYFSFSPLSFGSLTT